MTKTTLIFAADISNYGFVLLDGSVVSYHTVMAAGCDENGLYDNSEDFGIVIDDDAKTCTVSDYEGLIARITKNEIAEKGNRDAGGKIVAYVCDESENIVAVEC